MTNRLVKCAIGFCLATCLTTSLPMGSITRKPLKKQPLCQLARKSPWKVQAFSKERAWILASIAVDLSVNEYATANGGRR